MDSPYFERGESIILTTDRISLDAVQYDLVLTTRHLILVDPADPGFRPWKIPLFMVLAVKAAKIASNDPVITLFFSDTSRTGGSGQLNLIFSRCTDEPRERERDEWLRRLMELIVAVRQERRGSDTTPKGKVSGIRPATRRTIAPEMQPPHTTIIRTPVQPLELPIIHDEVSLPETSDGEGTPRLPGEGKVDSPRGSTEDVESGREETPSVLPADIVNIPAGEIHGAVEDTPIQPDSPGALTAVTPPDTNPAGMAPGSPGGETSETVPVTAEQAEGSDTLHPPPTPLPAPEQGIGGAIIVGVPGTGDIETSLETEEPRGVAGTPLEAPAGAGNAPAEESITATGLPGPADEARPEPGEEVVSAGPEKGGGEGTVCEAPVGNGAEEPGGTAGLPPLSPGPVTGRRWSVIVAAALILLGIAGYALINMGNLTLQDGGIIPHPGGNSIVTPSPTPSPQITSGPAQVSVPATGVWVRVTYPLHFSGRVGNPGFLRAVNSSGDQLYLVNEKNPLVQVQVYKTDNTGNRLSVEIIRDGTVILRRATTSPMGSIDVLIDATTGNPPGISTPTQVSPAETPRSG